MNDLCHPKFGYFLSLLLFNFLHEIGLSEPEDRSDYVGMIIGEIFMRTIIELR